ncbi:MAG: acyl-CoA dehydrogenase family protein [Burkholderiales bacterium]|nr:acyl-CoA dehydrogenase family protein [Burkholderiales bacterium]
MSFLGLAHCSLPPQAESLRQEVREFLAGALAGRGAAARAQSWDGFDPEFSRSIGARGWIGMTWPRRYGGAERSALERYVVIEEMLAAGAPVSAHWFGDRQTGPLLLRYGTEAQRVSILPAIARGELFFCIGMSEPDAGSDVAAIRSRARRVPGGWELSGAKVWTTNAHRAHSMLGLFRTAPEAAERHAGLSQFLVDMRSPGVSVRPITDMAGREHFNEVRLDQVFVPDSALVGTEGDGWAQVMAELAYERSGPERYLSGVQLLLELVRAAGPAAGERARVAVGRAVASMVTLRQMSLAIAGMLEAGANPAQEAAIVKDLGTAFEQSLPEVVHELLGVEPDRAADTDLGRVHAVLLELAPCFSLRGGTREVLRGIIARGLGLR